MSAVVIAPAYGGPDVLEIANQAPGEPGPGQALVEIRAAGVNPVDVKVYSGAFGTDPARLPLRLGSEASGVVAAGGPGAAGPAGPIGVGDEVIAYRAPGAYAEELVVPASALVPKPDTLDWAQASGLMVAGATAWHLLSATGVGAGDTVLIHGAAGGVGVKAVPLGRDRGAPVGGEGQSGQLLRPGRAGRDPGRVRHRPDGPGRGRRTRRRGRRAGPGRHG